MRNNKKQFLIFLLFPMIFLGYKAHACKGKTDGSLHGYVTDAVTKKPLPGVVVSAIIPGTNNFREVLTDSDGYFHFPPLPVTPVTVQFDKKGYQGIKKPGIQIKDKATIKLNVEFLPEGVDAEDTEERESENSEYPLLRMLQSN
ncbi:MAG: carboxypeptidase-like regulatory domain-containing protein [Puia sp.]|nr:carboxypeptidase-like regulatory domain-containing protein [Puia sp.]